jgi:hypothetical protein
VERLHDHGQLEGAPNPVRSLHDLVLGRRDAVVSQALLGTRLVQANAESERVAAGVGDAPELAERRDERLTTRTAETLGEVEDDVGARSLELERKEGVGLEPDDLARPSQGALDRGDRLLVVPLGVGVGEV